jgi:hypothetical protein
MLLFTESALSTADGQLTAAISTVFIIIEAVTAKTKLKLRDTTRYDKEY